MKRKIIKDALICGLGSFVDDVPGRSCYSQYFKAAHFFAGPRDKPTQRVITQFSENTLHRQQYIYFFIFHPDQKILDI